MVGGQAQAQHVQKKVFTRFKYNHLELFFNFLYNKKTVFCDFPTNILNAIPNVQVSNQSKYKIGTDVEYQCDIGYMPENENSNKITCLTTGKWSELKFKCSSNLFYI